MLAGLCMLLLASCGGKQETGGEQGSISPEPKTEVSDGEQDTQEGDGLQIYKSKEISYPYSAIAACQMGLIPHQT